MTNPLRTAFREGGPLSAVGDLAGGTIGSHTTAIAQPRKGDTAPRVFALRLQSRGGDDIRALKAILKKLLRPHGWRCLSVEPEARR